MPVHVARQARSGVHQHETAVQRTPGEHHGGEGQRRTQDSEHAGFHCRLTPTATCTILTIYLNSCSGLHHYQSQSAMCHTSINHAHTGAPALLRRSVRHDMMTRRKTSGRRAGATLPSLRYAFLVLPLIWHGRGAPQGAAAGAAGAVSLDQMTDTRAVRGRLPA